MVILESHQVGERLTIDCEGSCRECTVIKSVRTKEDSKPSGVLSIVDIPLYGQAEFFFADSAQYGNERRNRAGLPVEYVYKAYQDFDWNLYREDTRAVQRICKAFIERFDEFQKQGRALFVYSRTKGSGKTFLASVLGTEILKERDLSLKFCSESEYIDLIVSKDEASQKEREAVRTAGLLILDDFGAGQSKDWMQQAIFSLVNFRYSQLLPTIFTSNVLWSEAKADDRTISRVEAVSVPVPLPEQSIRSEQARKYTSDFLKTVLDGLE